MPRATGDDRDDEDEDDEDKDEDQDGARTANRR
jgi:hypothetical protein